MILDMSKTPPVIPVTIKLPRKMHDRMKREAKAAGLKISALYQQAVDYWQERAA